MEKKGETGRQEQGLPLALNLMAQEPDVNAWLGSLKFSVLFLEVPSSWPSGHFLTSGLKTVPSGL